MVAVLLVNRALFTYMTVQDHEHLDFPTAHNPPSTATPTFPAMPNRSLPPMFAKPSEYIKIIVDIKRQ